MKSTKSTVLRPYAVGYVAFALVLSGLYYIRNRDFSIDYSYITNFF